MKGQIQSANLWEQKASESQAGQNYRIIFHSRHSIRIHRLRASKSQLGEQLRDIDRLPQSYHGGCRDDRQQTRSNLSQRNLAICPCSWQPPKPPRLPKLGFHPSTRRLARRKKRIHSRNHHSRHRQRLGKLQQQTTIKSLVSEKYRHSRRLDKPPHLYRL